MLAEIAYQGFNNDQLFFQKQKLVNSIKDFLADTVDNPKYLDGQKILKAIAAQQGILVERAEDIYSFSHLTLQEYLTAQYISQEDIRIEELVTKHLTEKRWREIFLLVAGIKDDAGELLKLMEKVTQQCINTPKLQNLLVWVEKVTDTTPGDFQPVGKRAIALELAKAVALKLDLDIAEAIAKAKDFSKVKDFSHVNIYLLAKAIKLNFHPDIVIATAIAKAINIAAVIDGLIDYTQVSQKFQIYKNVNFTEINATLEKLKKQIPNCKEEKKVCQIFNNRLYQTFSNKLRQIWLEAFHLTPEMIDLSESELEALDNYFYANLLMVQCKKAAVRVSKETWQGIESRMLLPVDRNKSE
ncbi:MAG: NACHT domain-containing NTPase [Xenococcaceae cyanobacterium]